MFTRQLNGYSSVIGITVSNDGDFVQSKSFNGMQDKGFAIGTASALEGKLHQRDHLVGGSDVFRGRRTPVSDHVFLGQGLVWLMELESGLVTGANILVPGRILQMNRQQALRAAGREVVHGAERQPVKPWLEAQTLRLLSSPGPLAPRARHGFVDDFLLGDGIGSDLLGSFPEIQFALDEAFQAAEIGIYIRAD